MYVDMSRKRVLCVGFSSIHDMRSSLWELLRECTYGGVHALSQLVIAGERNIDFLRVSRRFRCRRCNRRLDRYYGCRGFVVQRCKGHIGSCGGLVLQTKMSCWTRRWLIATSTHLAPRPHLTSPPRQSSPQHDFHELSVFRTPSLSIYTISARIGLCIASD
jgi:hypothetical protein